jgi:hypothetical protein
VAHEIASLKAVENGWEVRSYKACQRYVAELPKAMVLKLRFGDEAFTNEAEPYIERDYSTLESNQIWCADHHVFDVLIKIVNTRTGVMEHTRPWLTAWQDLRSRKIVGWRVFAHDPNSDEILFAFKDAVREHGLPHAVYFDNGKDYDCFALQGRTKKDRWRERKVRFAFDQQRSGVFPGLSIDVMHAWPFHGQSKPIERWFGTIEQYTPVWPTYFGRNPQERPEDFQLNLERGKAPTLEEFSEWFDGIVQQYNAKPHSGDGMDGQSPDAVFAANSISKRTTTDEVLDQWCLRQPPGSVKVTQNGVIYQGVRYGQHDLLAHLGEQVTLRIDDKDLSHVQVWTLDGKIIARVAANQKMSWNPTSQELRDAIQKKKQARKLVRQWTDSRPRLHEDLPDLMLRARASSIQNSPFTIHHSEPPEAPALVPVRTSIDDQLPALRDALRRSSVQPLRTAVGAEALTYDELHAALSEDSESAPRSDPMAELRMALGGGGE